MKRHFLASTLLAMFVMFGLTRMIGAQGGDSFSVYYVAPMCDAMPTPCFTTIQAAIDAVDDSQDIVKVATGVYTDIHQIGTFQQIAYLSKTLTLRGGYRSDDWETAHPITQPTVLDAQGAARPLHITGPITPTIEGLQLRGGMTNEQWGSYGGGLDVITASATISDCVIENNFAAAGGGIYLNASTATLINTIVQSNTSHGDAAGIYLMSSPATLLSNTIRANTSEFGSGGGIFVLQSDSVTVAGNSIISNTAHVGSYGGGMYVVVSRANIYHNLIQDNRAGTGGGLNIFNSDLVIAANIIVSNTAQEGGGGLYIYGGTTHLIDSQIAYNRANFGGGFNVTQGAIVTVENNFITDNHLVGGLFGFGSGVDVYLASPLFRHNTLARNTGGSGEGISVDGNANTRVVLDDTILVSHTVGIHVTNNSRAELNATVWGTGEWQNQTDWLKDNYGVILTGSLNFWGDPAFVNPELGDYHIGASSVAHNHGVFVGTTTDIDGDYRLDNCHVDIGADEFIDGDGCPYRMNLPVIWR